MNPPKMQILTGKPPDQADRQPKTHPQRPENPFSAKYGRKFGVNAGAQLGNDSIHIFVDILE